MSIQNECQWRNQKQSPAVLMWCEKLRDAFRAAEQGNDGAEFLTGKYETAAST